MPDHDLVPQVQLDGVNWTDVTTQVDQTDPITVEHGFAQEGSLRPAKLSWTFLNDGDAWRPSSPTSPLFASSGRRMNAAMAMDGEIVAVTEAAKYQPDETLGFTAGPPVRGRRWVGFEAEGVMRRINTWTGLVRSPLYRQITSYATLRGYWPLEDSREATQSTNAYRGGRPGYLENITLGAAGPDGSASAAQVGTSGWALASGWFSTMSVTAGFQLHAVLKLKQIPLNSTPETMFRWSTSTGYDYQWNVNNGSYTMRVLDPDGNQILNSSVLFGSGAEPGLWMAFRWKVYQSGANVIVESQWNTQGASVPTYGLTFTVPNATVGRPMFWRVQGNQHTWEMQFCHVFGLTGVADDMLSNDMNRAFDGYVGETASARFERLCRQHGIPWRWWGVQADTMPMGRQRPAKLIDLLKECMQTDDGLVFDAVTKVGLHYRSRRNLINQTPKIVLQYGVHIAPPLTEVIDDLGIANVVTVKQVDGAEYTASLDSGPMSSAPPPAGVGEQEQSIEVNINDESRLPQLAWWRLARGTVAGSRWPQVTVDLDRPGVTAADRTAIAQLTPGDRVQVTGRTPDAIDLLVIGFQHKLAGRYRRQTVLTCIPYDPYIAGVYNNSGSRYDAADSATTTNLAGGSGGTYSTTHGTIYVATPSTQWGTQTPYDIEITGERMTVNSVFASGSGQGLNVTRSVNGVVKTHAAGEPVHLAAPVRYAL